MSQSEIVAVWYARLPHHRPAPPDWMSFSRLLEIEGCPRRWSLNAALYPEIWSRQGYPPKVHLATLQGQVIHSGLETISNALSRAGCPSVTDERFVGVMRELGGYTKIIEAAIKRLTQNLHENPRFASKANYISTKLRRSVPVLREQLQIMTTKLRLRDGAKSSTVSGSETPVAVRLALSNGIYSEVELRAEGLRWRGFVDALTVSDTGCEIVDYKTGVPKPEHEEQLRVYSLLWVRDEQINPTGRTFNRLTLAYPTIDVNVESPSSTQLDILEQEISSRTKSALGIVGQDPPPALPSINNCAYCQVRQLCGDYWTPHVQSTLAEEVLRLSSVAKVDFFDLEIEDLKQQTPLSWTARVVLCRILSTGSQVLVRIAEPTQLLEDIFNSGKRIRVLDGRLVDQPEDAEMRGVYLTKASEAYIV